MLDCFCLVSIPICVFIWDVIAFRVFVLIVKLLKGGDY